MIMTNRVKKDWKNMLYSKSKQRNESTVGGKMTNIGTKNLNKKY